MLRGITMGRCLQSWIKKPQSTLTPSMGRYRIREPAKSWLINKRCWTGRLAATTKKSEASRYVRLDREHIKQPHKTDRKRTMDNFSHNPSSEDQLIGKNKSAHSRKKRPLMAWMALK
jgi:hypothetical protein